MCLDFTVSKLEFYWRLLQDFQEQAKKNEETMVYKCGQFNPLFSESYILYK